MRRANIKILGLCCLVASVNACAATEDDVIGTDEAANTSGEHPVKYSVDHERRVGTAQIDLARYSKTDLTKAVEITGARLPSSGVIPAQDLLAPFARSKALTYPREEIVNCWYTAIASISPDFESARYMTDKELSCHLESSFEQVDEPRFGDLVRFRDAKGEEVHAATYIGTDAATGKIVVFSKNGPTIETPFGFTTLDVLRERVYSETKTVTFHRPKREVLDPKRPGQPCFREAEQSRLETGQMGGGGGGGGFFDDWSPM